MHGKMIKARGERYNGFALFPILYPMDDKMSKQNKRFYIKTYGCQMNDYDSAKLEALLLKHGYSRAEEPEDADYIIANTCSVRKSAEDRAFAFLSTQKPLRKKGTKICLLGCMANLYGPDLLKKHRFLDIVCGPNNYKDLPEILEKGGRQSFTGDSADPFLEVFHPPDSSLSACITVTKGCENFCSYCVVPFTRGKLASRPPETILKEIEWLSEKGVREITLLGQNVNEYGRGTETDFSSLLEKVQSIGGITRIGFTTSHPKDIPEKLIGLFKTMPRLYKHLHLPMQSGSDRILALMNRKYTLEKYMCIVDKAREAFQDINITSDIIVGYPGEKKSDFDETCRAIEKISFDDLFVFKYSNRPGTPASMMKETVSSDEKENRHKTILSIQDSISLSRNERYLGKKLPVFMRSASGKKKGFLVGRTITNKPVLIKSGGENLGLVMTAEITKAFRRYLAGVLCDVNRQEKVSSPSRGQN